MNYYIQGNKEKAEEIKAAFEKLGYKTIEYCFNAERTLYFTFGDAIKTATYEPYKSIIKTHPDYKELELPVESKFKVGDWIACDADSFTLSIKSVRDVNYYFHQGESLPIKYIDEHYHLWTIQDAKDGDVLVDTLSGTRELTILFISINEDDSISAYCGWNGYTFRVPIDGLGYGTLSSTRYVPATKEQRNLFFTKMREAGYQWDSEKEELRKIKPHYDIKNFQPFDKVLVRCSNDEEWMIEFYCKYDTLVHTSPHRDYPFMGIGDSYSQCIPFEGNEHLLGTTDMCDEQYINW